MGGVINSIKVLNKEEVKGILSENTNVSFIISPWNENVCIQIAETIRREFGYVHIKDLDELQNEYIRWKHENIKGEKYDIQLEREFEDWGNNIIGEVDYSIKHAMEKSGVNHISLLNSIDNDLVPAARGEYGNVIYKYLYADAVLMDIGSSSIAKYGSFLPNGIQIKSYPVDALAFFYNKLYEKYVPKCNKKIEFALFEFIANFYEKSFADVILIENALDHSIDPVMGILECLEILKPQGLLRMFHRRCEAVFEAYLGLHKWNIDYNDNLELIVWNEKNYVNVNRKLGNDAEIRVIPMTSSKRISDMFVVEIKKRKSYDYRKYIDVETENKSLAGVLRIIMEKWAETYK